MPIFGNVDNAPYNPILNKRVISDNLCLKIDFGNYDNDRARELINSKTELSLLLASKFLKKIRNSAHNKSSERLGCVLVIKKRHPRCQSDKGMTCIGTCQ